MAPQFIAQIASAENPAISSRRREYCMRRCVDCDKANRSDKFRLCVSVDSRAQIERSAQSERDVPPPIQRRIATSALLGAQHTRRNTPGTFAPVAVVHNPWQPTLPHGSGENASTCCYLLRPGAQCSAQRPTLHEDEMLSGMLETPDRAGAFPPDSRAAQQIGPT